MLQGVCLVLAGPALISAMTISWSERPGEIEILFMRIGLDVKIKSKYYDIELVRSPFVQGDNH